MGYNGLIKGALLLLPHLLCLCRGSDMQRKSCCSDKCRLVLQHSPWLQVQCHMFCWVFGFSLSSVSDYRVVGHTIWKLHPHW